MNRVVSGGKNVYGYDIGILVLDSTFPRIRGDVGNAKSYDFPVLYKKVRGGLPKKVVLNLRKEDIQPFAEGAVELEKEGVKAITTSCGFLALFQEELSSCVDIPVFTSALLFVPMLSQMVGKGKKIGILTANSMTLTECHMQAVGIEPSKCKVVGLEGGEEFTNFTVQNRDKVDVESCRKELIAAAQRLVGDGDVGMIVLECTNMPPYSYEIHRSTGLPVFDIVMLTNLFYSAMNPKRFDV